MRKYIACFVSLAILICVCNVAFAEHAFIVRNGICFKDDIRVVSRAEGDNGTVSEIDDYGVVKLEYNNVQIEGATTPIKVTYGFIGDELKYVEYGVTDNRTFSDLYSNQDDVWVDAEAALSDAIQGEYWEFVVGDKYSGASLNEEAVIHPDTPEQLKSDMVWGVFRATGQDLTGNFEGYPLEVEDLIIYLYDQIEFDVGGDNVLLSTLITANQAGNIVRARIRLDLIN